MWADKETTNSYQMWRSLLYKNKVINVNSVNNHGIYNGTSCHIHFDTVKSIGPNKYSCYADVI